MKRLNRLRKLLLSITSLLAFPVAVHAQPLEDVSLEYQSRGVVATIQLSGPIQYLRHFPESHGKTLEIFYDRVKDASSSETWHDNEVRQSPPSRLIPGFTVTTRNQASNPELVIEFSREAEFSVAAGKDNRSLLVTIIPDKRQVVHVPLPFLPTIKPEEKPAAGKVLTAAEEEIAKISQQARDLMIQSRDALAAKKNDVAVVLLNKLLLLPPNDYTEEGQEWIGVARERDGQDEKAKVEYDLYLRIYPNGDGVERVTERLQGLSGVKEGPAMSAAADNQSRKPKTTTFGSVSTTYYYSKSKVDATSIFNNSSSTSSFSQTDQSMLLTTADISERYQGENTDSRLVFRDVDTRNFVSGQPSENRVNAAYGEIKGRTQNYLVRAGRQAATGGGVLGRFDGVAGSYGDAQVIKVNAAAGALVDYSQGPKPRFYGASVDKGDFSIYGINQTVEGLQDRRAVGTEYRHFDDKSNIYGLLDYDTYFKAVNAVQLMGSTKGVAGLPENAMLNIMLDHRKTPSLSIRNALNGATVSSVSALQQTMSVSSIRDLALSRTAMSNMGQIGVTVPYHRKYQVGGDFRLTNTTGLPQSGQTTVYQLDAQGLPIPGTGTLTSQCTGAYTPQGCLDAQQGRGLEKSLTGQIIGSSLYKQGDIWSGSVTFSTSGSVNSQSMFFYNHTQSNSGWMMDVTLQLSNSKDQFGGKTTQYQPMLHGTYGFGRQFTFDGNLGFQHTKYSGPQMTITTARLFASGGVRWDF
jgi:hypothetical protein